MTHKKTLVLGASLKPQRYSNMVVHSLIEHQIPTCAFGLKQGSILDVTVNTDLITYPDIHTITLYLNPNRQQQYYDYILSLNPKRVIFNPGTENPELMQLLERNKISYEMACSLVLLSTNQY
jgi:predicted CoA-binding protein